MAEATSIPDNLALYVETGCWECDGPATGVVRLTRRSDGTVEERTIADGAQPGGIAAVAVSADGSQVAVASCAPTDCASLSLPPNYTFLACLVPTTLFWLLGIHLFIGAAEVPRRSYFLFWTLVASTIVYFAMSWDLHLAGVIAMNVMAVLLVWRLLASARRRPSFWRNLAFHWTLVAWLSWFAFPW